jgi:hypothetical protein
MDKLGYTSGSEFLKRVVKASANIHIPTGDDAAREDAVHHPCTQFELDSLTLKALALVVTTLNTAESTKYGEQIEVLKVTEAGKSRPVLLVRIAYLTGLLQAMMNGDIDMYFDWCWKLTKMVLDLNDERTDAYSRLNEDERHLVKPASLSYICLGGDAMMRTRDFKLDFYGPNGDKLVEWANAYTYAEHHVLLADVSGGLDGWLAYGGADWLLTMLYGRVSDAISIVEARRGVLKKVVAAPSSRARPKEIIFATSTLLVCYHLHGQSQLTSKHFEVLGITFDSVSDYLSKLIKTSSMFCSMDHTGLSVGNGFVSLKRLCWQIMAFFVLHTDMPASKAIAWLESLPNDKGFYQVSMTKPTHDIGGLCGFYQTCWLALAHEKVGLYDGALRFCRLALEPDLKKAGTPYSKWTLIIAFACKGRVLAKLNQHTEALTAFQAGIATSKESYPMMKVLAYRELANCNAAGDAPAAMAEAAAHAERDLAEKLKGFDGRLTRAEFDMVTIAPA